MSEIGALLERIGRQLRTQGTLRLGGTEFRLGETARVEIGARGRGFSIELSAARE